MKTCIWIVWFVKKWSKNLVLWRKIFPGDRNLSYPVLCICAPRMLRVTKVTKGVGGPAHPHGFCKLVKWWRTKPLWREAEFHQQALGRASDLAMNMGPFHMGYWRQHYEFCWYSEMWRQHTQYLLPIALEPKELTHGKGTERLSPHILDKYHYLPSVGEDKSFHELFHFYFCDCKTMRGMPAAFWQGAI